MLPRRRRCLPSRRVGLHQPRHRPVRLVHERQRGHGVGLLRNFHQVVGDGDRGPAVVGVQLLQQAERHLQGVQLLLYRLGGGDHHHLHHNLQGGHHHLEGDLDGD